MAPPTDRGETLGTVLPGNHDHPSGWDGRTSAKYIVDLAFIGVAYFLLAKLGLALASIHPSATPIWPPTGFALAAVILRGHRIAPAIFLAALVANATTAGSVYSSAGIAVGNTLEALLGGYLVSRWSGGVRAFASPATIARFALICLAVATPISATIGVGSLGLAGYIDGDRIAPIWVTWWLGDLAGALVITPVLVLWATSRGQALGRQQLLEGGAVLLAACLVGVIAFSPLIEQSANRDPLGFLAVVPLMWAALRRGQRDTATVALVLSCFAIWGTLLGSGPFARPTLNDSFLLLVMFVISTSLPSLALSADVAIRRRTDEDLRRAHAELSRQVESGSAALAETQLALRQAREMEEALRESEHRLQLALGIAGLGTWEYDLARDTATWSPQVAEIFGLPGRTTVTYSEWVSHIHPDDRSRIEADFKAALANGRDYHPEYRVVRPDGSERWIACRTTVLRDRDGTPLRVLGIAHDMTEARAAAERQSLLMAELDHRVRNILSAAQSMVVLTARQATTKEAYATALRGRIGAMARAHGLVTREHWRGIDLADLLADALQPYGEAILLSGGRGCILRAKDAVNLALGLHELATNAAKHGALSQPGGRVEVAWQVLAGEPPRLRLVWQETGGPPVKPPTRRGFGLQLIENVMPNVELRFDAAGMRYTIELELRSYGGAAAVPGRKPEESRETADGAGKPLQGERVLIVEDETLVMLAFRAALEEAGAEIVGAAATLGEAKALMDADVSLAVLDINLQGEMSFPLAEQLVARGIPVLFATGYDATNLAPPHLRAIPTLQKPIDGIVLVRRLVELAGKMSSG